jgi:hypothetical protein
MSDAATYQPTPYDHMVCRLLDRYPALGDVLTQQELDALCESLGDAEVGLRTLLALIDVELHGAKTP